MGQCSLLVSHLFVVGSRYLVHQNVSTYMYFVGFHCTIWKALKKTSISDYTGFVYAVLHKEWFSIPLIYKLETGLKKYFHFSAFFSFPRAIYVVLVLVKSKMDEWLLCSLSLQTLYLVLPLESVLVQCPWLPFQMILSWFSFTPGIIIRDNWGLVCMKQGLSFSGHCEDVGRSATIS